MSHVLIVDDKEENLYLLRTLLEADNKTVSVASQGVEALEKLRNAHTDIIVSDILMPVMDGFALCIEVKKDPKLQQIPFIFYTATYTDPKDEEFALGLGADRFLTKPLEPEDIVFEINRVLSKPIKSNPGDKNSAPDEKVVLKLYNQTLIRKLETKMSELEALNMQLVGQVAEQKRTEKALRKSERLLREVTGSIPGVVYQFIMKPNGQMAFTFVSDGALEMLGVPPDAIYGDAQKAFALMHPDDLKPALDSIIESAATISPWTMVFRAMHQDGTYNWIQGKSIPKKQEDGTIMWNGAFFDYTEIKNYQINLENKNSELIKANSELDRFVYSASHDMRAPLTSMMGLILLTKEEMDNVDMSTRLDMMYTTVKKLDDFIHKILDYSRNIRVDLEHNEINWEELIDEICENMKFMNADEKCHFTQSIEQTSKFYTDKHRLLIVLNNLFSNALKYQDTAKSEIEVKLNIVSDDQKAIITLQDNGIGIAPEHQDKVFDMFFRASSISTGSGLGLYIARETIEKLFGNISFTSIPGVGTTFKVKIPNLQNNNAEN